MGIQGVIAGLAIVYGVSTFVVHRPPSGYNTIWDGWIYTAAETLPVIPVLLRARRSSELRSAWLAMAAMIVLNTLGDLVYTYHDQNLLPIPDPAPSDVLYLLSYGAFIVGVALLTQSSFGRVHASVRLDGAIAGLAMGAVAGMVWFGPLLRVGGRPLQVAVAMAYPLADLVLIVLLVAGLAPHRYRPNSSTVLLLAGVASFVLGDVIYMNRSVAGTYVAGTPLDETWIIGLYLVGLAASVRDRRRSWGPRASVSSPAGITAVPVVFGLVSLAVLAAAQFRHASPAVSVMAIAALCLVIGRMWMTLREVRQMTEREMHQSAANFRDARTDYLTGLPNRRAFLDHLESAFSSGADTAVRAGVLMVDLDGFKEINDTLGHAVGDELLCVVARRFEHRLGAQGFLARLGGDEYAFACPSDREQDMVAVAHEFCEALSDPCVIDGTSVRVGASIGIGVSPPGGSTAGELMRCADVAMYEAKRTQCGVTAYRAENDPNDRDRLALVDELRDAIDARSLILHFQPTLDMRTAKIRGTESALGGDPVRAERCVRELRARGLRISIDDYGVGYSSMSQLLGLAIDELKIDKFFVMELISDPRAQAIVRSAVEVARALDLTVVAEGIEEEEVLWSLRQIGADIGQGYAISYPLPSRELDEYLAHPDRVRQLFRDLPLISN